MISRGSRVQLSVGCLLLLVGGGSVACDEGSYAAQTKKLLLWLPDETESLFVSKGAKYEVGEERAFAPVFPCGSEGALSVIRGGRFQKRLVDHPVVMTVQASCRFRRPDVDRAPVQYAGCQLVLFERGITLPAKKLLEDMTVDADGSLKIGGRHAVRFREEWNRQEWVFLVCFPTPKVLVIATDEQYLRRLIDRIDHPTSVSFLHDNRLEAELTRHADAPIWAVRRFKEPSLESDIPRSAKGFFFRLVEPNMANIIFLAGQGATANSVRDIWKLFPPVGTNPEVTDIGDGVFEVRHSLSEQEKWGGFWLLLLWRLGHHFG